MATTSTKAQRPRAERQRSERPKGSTTNNIRVLRERSGRTKADIANAAGLTVSHFAKLEEGHRPLKWEYVKALAKAFGVDPKEIAEPVVHTMRIGVIVGDGDVRLFGEEGFPSNIDDFLTPRCRQLGFEPKPTRVKSPPDATEKTVALYVIRNAMSPIAEACCDIYFDNEPRPASELLNRLCVVWPVEEDGTPSPLRICRIHRGDQYGKFDLVSVAGEATPNVPLKGAARITWIGLSF